MKCQCNVNRNARIPIYELDFPDKVYIYTLHHVLNYII